MEHERTKRNRGGSWPGFLTPKEFEVKGVRSSGAGGQNVNKVATKAQLRFNLENASSLSAEEKTAVRSFILRKRPSALTSEGEIVLSNSDTRSFEDNKNRVIAKLYEIIEEALTPKLPRIPTKKPKSADKKRLAEKKMTGERKRSRQDRGEHD